MGKKSTSQLFTWLKAPASWLALVATGVSISTFYLVHADPGQIKIVLPDRIGLEIEEPGHSLILILPVTFTNTGAPRTYRHVTRLSARLYRPNEISAFADDPLFTWKYEHEFIGYQAYLKKYPDAEDTGSIDYLDYVGQSFPFALAGGKSVTKVYEMRQIDGNLSDRELVDFTFLITASTEREDITSQSSYKCSHRITNKTVNWCNIVIE